MQVLFTSVPAPSHVDPLLHLATALDAAGHEVTFITGPALVPRIERAGFRAVAAGLDWNEPEADRTFPEIRGLSLPDLDHWWVHNIFFDRHARPMATDVARLLDDGSFDLLVRTHVEFGGWAAAVARGVPQVVVQLGQAWSTERLPWIGDGVAHVLHGLAPGRDVDLPSLHGDLMLLLHPASYDPLTPQVPWFRCRPPVPLPLDPVPPRPEALAGAPSDRPVVLVTFGTVFNRTEGAFEVVLEALAGLDVTAIVTVGSTRDPDALGPVPEHVRVLRYAAYAELLPHCDVVLGHGGFSTTMSALLHGVPLVTMPLGADQPWNGGNTARLGLGRVVEFEGVTPVRVADAITTVLGDPAYRAGASAYADELRALPGWDEAAARVAEVG